MHVQEKHNHAIGGRDINAVGVEIAKNTVHTTDRTVVDLVMLYVMEGKHLLVIVESQNLSVSKTGFAVGRILEDIVEEIL